MKKPAVIFAAVAGYSLFEAALLLLFMLPEYELSYAGSQHIFLGLAQFLTLPGMAALFSLLVHGRYRWKTRMLFILLAGTVGIPVAFLVALLPTMLLAWALDTSVVLFFVLLPFAVGAIAWLLFLLIRKRANGAFRSMLCNGWRIAVRIPTVFNSGGEIMRSVGLCVFLLCSCRWFCYFSRKYAVY
jgi:hypothetical protein